MQTRIIAVKVLDFLGRPLSGVMVTLRHSSGRVIFNGQTSDSGSVSVAESYDPDESGYLEMRAEFAEMIASRTRLITKTVVSNSVTAAYQCVILYNRPRKRF